MGRVEWEVDRGYVDRRSDRIESKLRDDTEAGVIRFEWRHVGRPFGRDNDELAANTGRKTTIPSTRGHTE